MSFLVALILTVIPDFSMPLEYKRLDNGLEVVVLEDHTVPLVTVQVWYKVGSKYERYGKTGISHMLEHMMFKGTKNLPPGEYHKFIRSVGGTENAFTSKERTVYWSVVPSKYLEKILEIESDRMVNCVFNDFESEKNVVAEERRWSRENSPMGRLWDSFYATLFMSHPYHHPVIGWMSDIENFSLHDVKKHYERYYAPDNALLVVVGDVKSEDVFKLAKKYFGRIKKRSNPTEVISKEPDWNETRTLNLTGENYPRVLMVGYAVPGYKHADYPALEILSIILGEGLSSRLQDILVDKGIATRAGSWLSSMHDYSVFAIQAYPSPGIKHDSLLRVIDEEIERIKRAGVTEEELERALRLVYANLVISGQSLYRRGLTIGNFYIVADDPLGVNHYFERLKGVKLEDIKRVASKYLLSTKRVIAFMDTKKESE